MPMEASGVAITTSHMPSRAALPAKQRPETTPIRGTVPVSVPSAWKVMTSRAEIEVESTSPGRPPPPSGNRNTGRRRSRASPSIRSVLAWLRIPWVPASTV